MWGDSSKKEDIKMTQIRCNRCGSELEPEIFQFMKCYGSRVCPYCIDECLREISDIFCKLDCTTRIRVDIKPVFLCGSDKFEINVVELDQKRSTTLAFVGMEECVDMLLFLKQAISLIFKPGVEK